MEKKSTSIILGDSLRRRRIENHWTQKEASVELDLTLSTYRKMECGDEGVALSSWIKAWDYFRATEDVERALSRPMDLFYELDEKLGIAPVKRLRARKK